MTNVPWKNDSSKIYSALAAQMKGNAFVYYSNTIKLCTQKSVSEWKLDCAGKLTHACLAFFIFLLITTSPYYSMMH